MSVPGPVGDDYRRYVLSLGCRDDTGIVARITTFIAELGGSIVEAGYHADADSGWFFTRQAVRASSIAIPVDELRNRFATVAAAFGPETDWRVHDTGAPKRVVLLVSKEAHCLHDLLGRAAGGELTGDHRGGDRQPRRPGARRPGSRRRVPSRAVPA